MSTSETGRAGWSLGWKITALALATTVAATVLLSWLAHRVETRAAVRGVEARLRAIAVAVPAILPADYHERINAGAVSAAEYDGLVRRLTELARGADVWYLYTFIERDGRVLTTSTSATEEELATGRVAALLEPYQRPPEQLRLTLRDGVTRFASYTDEFGSFHSIFLGAGGEGAEGGQYVVGADVRLDDLRAAAAANLRTQVLAGLGVGGVVSLLGALAGRRIARPLAELAASIRRFADEDFHKDERTATELSRLVRTGGPETRTLAATILEMQRKLGLHIEQLKVVTAEKERITSQLQIARDIQRSLLPAEPPPVEGWDIVGWSEAAEQAGGDFYDWMMTPRGEVVVCVADVTGHGIGPAITASVCRSYARATLEAEKPLRALMERLNQLVHADTRGEQFVTFFAGVLRPELRRMEILSAGHGPLLVYRAATGTIEQPGTHGIPLGIMEEAEMEGATEIAFEPGDTLLVVSDGFFEWMNKDREQFGVERLEAALAEAATRPAKEIIEHIRHCVGEFTRGTIQPDDMTAVVVRLGK